MAEFSEVMRQAKRMCKAHVYCEDCPWESPCIYGSIEEVDYEAFERTVMDWAAAHPEPVYPTWYEYLTSIYSTTWQIIAEKHIPTDKAELLGVKAKEES